MRPYRHSYFTPLAIFVMMAASLVFFLPAAISMNSQNALSTAQGNAPAPDVMVYKWNDGDPMADKKEKGSLPLRTAAIIGRSAAGIAAHAVHH